YLATRGAVGIRVEYRVMPKGNADPPIICCHDAKSAMRYVRSHASELGIDPDRIAAAGGSAGGHLAAFASMVEGQDDPADDLTVSPRGNALILFNPVFDNGPEGGWGTARVGDRYREFSPAHNITPDDPPAIVFLGSEDALISVSVLERFQAKMAAEGVRCDARIYDGQAHGFFNKDPWRTLTLIEADKFLGSLGWLTGEPTLAVPSLESAKATGAEKGKSGKTTRKRARSK
ncbi:MAG: alpha/beta hydrolase, partial [Planctomycetaceae bacterium]